MSLLGRWRAVAFRRDGKSHLTADVLERGKIARSNFTFLIRSRQSRQSWWKETHAGAALTWCQRRAANQSVKCWAFVAGPASHSQAMILLERVDDHRQIHMFTCGRFSLKWLFALLYNPLPPENKCLFLSVN